MGGALEDGDAILRQRQPGIIDDRKSRLQPVIIGQLRLTLARRNQSLALRDDKCQLLAADSLVMRGRSPHVQLIVAAEIIYQQQEHSGRQHHQR